jgi:hypothetical protein
VQDQTLTTVDPESSAGANEEIRKDDKFPMTNGGQDKLWMIFCQSHAEKTRAVGFSITKVGNDQKEGEITVDDGDNISEET